MRPNGGLPMPSPSVWHDRTAPNPRCREPAIVAVPKRREPLMNFLIEITLIAVAIHVGQLITKLRAT